MPNNYRITLTLSPYQLRQLIKWSKVHGKTKSVYAAQMLGAKIEENLQLINDQVAEIARHEGITPQELERRWLLEEKYEELVTEPPKPTLEPPPPVVEPSPVLIQPIETEPSPVLIQPIEIQPSSVQIQPSSVQIHPLLEPSS